jgi:hypothetical protein
VHPLRLVVIGLGTIGVGIHFWLAYRQMLTWQANGDPRAGRWTDDGHLHAAPFLVCMGLSVVLAGLVAGVSGSAAAAWAAGAVGLVTCELGYRPLVRRYPELDIGDHATKDQIWTVRVSDGHGPVFWGIVACAAILIGSALVVIATA